MKINKSIKIEECPEKIWPFLVEPEKIVQWCFTLQSFEYTSQVPFGVDTTFKYLEKGRFRLLELSCIITEWIENEKITFEMTKGKEYKGYRETWLIEPSSEGSKFSFVNQNNLALGIIGKIWEPVARRRAEVTVKNMLGRLKKLVEEDGS